MTPLKELFLPFRLSRFATKYKSVKSSAQNKTDLWRKATDHTLSTAEKAQFKRLLAHEYVERGLMAAGIPYHSRNKKAWIEDEDGDFRPLATKGHYGAHALAPHPNSQLKPFALWERRLGLSADGLMLANDLSNLDEIIEEILRRVEHAKGDL